MPPLRTDVEDLATRVGTEFKTTKTLIAGNNQGDLSGLDTTAQTNLVAAINEVNTIAEAAAGGGVAISDGTTTTTSTWSSQKISDEIAGVDVDLTDLINDTTASGTTVYSSTKTDERVATAVAGLVNAAPDTLNTLGEIATLVEANEDAIAGLNRVRYDTAQSLTGPEQVQARSNIGAGSAADVTALRADVGDLTGFDPVATFEAGLA